MHEARGRVRFLRSSGTFGSQTARETPLLGNP